jgi:hypothetical protein
MNEILSLILSPTPNQKANKNFHPHPSKLFNLTVSQGQPLGSSLPGGSNSESSTRLRLQSSPGLTVAVETAFLTT